MRPILIAIIAALATCVYAGAQPPSDEEDPYFLLAGEAQEAIKNEDYPLAAQRLRQALNIDPNRPGNAMLLSNLGMVYSAMDQDTLAILTFDHALEIAPSMVAIYANRGRLHLKMGHTEEAYRDFTSALERDSMYTDALFYRGMMSLYGGNAAGAEADIQRLATVQPDDYNTIAALGALYSLTGRDREAVPQYRRLIELDPSPEYYSALAGCYLALGELSDAAETITSGLKLYSHDPELYYYRAWLNRDRYLLDQAHADAQKAVNLGADPAKVQRLFGRPTPKPKK